MNYHALCFVDMPFGQKSDLKSGVIVDFDQTYDNAIKPAIEQCGLDELAKRLGVAIDAVATNDSPLFQLIPKFPGIDLPDEVTETFKEPDESYENI